MSEPLWTDARVSILKEMWAAGVSASVIAGRLGGVSRNAVLGKIHRMENRKAKITGEPKKLRRQAMVRVEKLDADPAQDSFLAKRIAARRSLHRQALEQIEADVSPIMASPQLMQPLQRDDGSHVLFYERVIGKQCAYIFGEPAYDVPVCGHSVGPEGSQYCYGHHKLLNQPAATARNRRAA